ncbi:uncharacterized protein LOC123321403 [Coccinella septempunctata]|uniref:uncharacterized protein LOC123321403 n=1 Tax=Coccinella septempunctata TaxID=41139 RepID=UPI001D079125|nr:uncharacterized protein LOC123321403 [Coccinella septempunctata]
MDSRFPKRNRRGQFDAGPSFVPRSDQFFQPCPFVPHFGRGTPNRDNTSGQTKRNNQFTRWYDKDGRQPKRNYQQLSRSNSVSSESSSVRLNDAGKSKNYTCPMCKHPYSFIITNNTLTGNVPRILPCKHTVCEECINKCIKTTNHIQCVICSKTEFEKKQSYEFNHYVLGQITCSRFNNTMIEFPNIALTATDVKSRTSFENQKLAVHPSEKCGFKNCKNSGTISCIDCCGVYCKYCDDALHKSGKQLLSHKRVPLKNASLELCKCPDHSMDQELYCNDCNESCCCYCILEKHEGHSRSYLGRLNEAEEAELLDAYEKAKITRKQLAVSQSKISKMEETNVVSDLEMEIAQHFVDIHAQLYFMEKKLVQEAKLFKSSNSNLTGLNEDIVSKIETLDNLISCVEERKSVKFNMRMLLDKLREMKNLPTILVASEIHEKPRLVIDERVQELEKYFKLDVPEEVTYKLIEVDELPLEYREENIELVSKEKKIESSKSRSSLDSEPSSNSRFKLNHQTKNDRFRQQTVYVTHINSLDSFYVQHKEDDSKFKQLEQEIKNHVSRMTLGVNEVQMKELYLARRVGNDNAWSRVRVMEKFDIDRKEKYKVKFIDFGNTDLVTKDEMMYISSSLAKKKPFAFECRLDNPSNFKWPKHTHWELAKLIDVNKELLMFTKEFSNNICTVELNISTSIGGSCSVTDLLIFGCDALRKDSNKSQPIRETPVRNKIYDNSDIFIVGNSYEVFIRYILDPWHIYVQKTTYENSFNHLIKQMEGYYNKSNCDIHLPIKNSYVVVFHQTENFGKWHRAKIVDVSEEKKTANVYLIDLGEHFEVLWKNIRKLFEPFKKSECLVVCAKLADVAPLNNDSWSNLAVIREYLERYFKGKVRMKMLVSNQDPLEMVLFEPQQNYDININASLVEMNLASSTGRLTETKIWLLSEEDGMNEENNILFFKDDSEDEETDNIQGLIQQVEMIRFENPFSFYVSFVSKKADAEKLHEELQIHYKSQKPSSIEKKNWQKNEKVVVYDKSDNMYYRGIIRKVDGNKYCVNFLDKPNYLWVDSEKLRLIAPYFANNFPNSVFKCHLANIKPAGDSSKWSNLSLEWFQLLFKKHDEIFMKKIADDESKLSMPVTMWYSKLIQGAALEPSHRKFISIDKKVVKVGLAFWVNNEISRSLSPKKEEPSTSTQHDQEQTVMNDVCDTKLSETETTDSEAAFTPLRDRKVKSVNIKEWKQPLNFTTKEFFAYITCAENKGYLFIREEKMQKCYEEMEKNMKEYFDTIPIPSFTMRENQMVTVRSDGNWYRSVILKVIDKVTALILMVDFGSDHIVKVNDLHNKIMYPEIPIMVSKIKLHDVLSKEESWTESEIETLISTAPEYAKIVIRSSLSDAVPLADVYNVNDVCYNDLLVELCPNLYRSQHNVTEESKNSNHIKSTANSEYIKNNEYCDSPSTDIQPEQNEEAVEEIEDEVENGSVEIEGYSTVEREENNQEGCVAKRYNYAEFTEEITEMDIIAVYDYKTVSIYHPDTQSLEEDFEALTKTIRDNIDSVEYLENESIEIGLPCLSLFEDDKQWYRAKILRVDAQDCGYITVIYVDYGNFEVVKISDLKCIKPEWLDFPARFADATIDYKLLRTDQENVLSKHIQSLAGETKYIKMVNVDPLLVHIYDKHRDDYSFYYDVFVTNGIVEV